MDTAATLPETTTPKAPRARKPKIKKSTLPKKAAYFILYVPDMAKAVDFYKNTLNLKVGFESPEWTEFQAGIKFALHGPCQESTGEYKASKTGLVFGVKDAGVTCETFKALGIKIVSEPRQVCEEGRSFCFEDPFGNVLSCYGK